MGQGGGAACLGSRGGGNTLDNNSSSEAWDIIFRLFGQVVPLPDSPGSFLFFLLLPVVSTSL